MTTPTRPVPAVTPPRPLTADGACETCPHALREHDAISLRFCAATQAATTTRGCVCTSA